MPSSGDMTINGFGTYDVRLTAHLHGAWTADVLTAPLTTPDLTPGTPVQLYLQDTQWNGTVVRGGPWRGGEYARIIGGAGGLGEAATQAAYGGPTGFEAPWSLIIQGLLRPAGEQLSSTATVAGTTPSWAIASTDTVAVALDRIVDAMSLASQTQMQWRVLNDGTIWIGVDTFATQSAIQDSWGLSLIDEYPERGEFLLGLSSSAIAPGQTLTYTYGSLTVGGPVSSVEYHFGKSGKYRARVLLVDQSGASQDRLQGPVQIFVNALMKRVLTHVFWKATVVNQNIDGTLNLRPVPLFGCPWGDLSNVPIFFGIPGVQAQVPPGDVVSFGFLGESPGGYFVAGWSVNAACTKLTINDGTNGAARNGDPVSVTVTGVQPGVGSVTATGTITAGSTTIFLG